MASAAPAATATDFEAHSHEQLLAMIASLDPETVRTRAAQLTEAAKAIGEIGESLKRHRVRGWEGEAAHAYQDWVSRTGSATLALGDYTETSGRWLTHAAQTMVEVRANTPPYDSAAAETLRSTTPHPNDPDARALAAGAHTKLTADHTRAVQQLTKLAQSYALTTSELTRAEPPTFPPPPAEFEPKGSGHDEFSRTRGDSGLDRISGSAGPERYASAARGGVPTERSAWSPRHALPDFESSFGPVVPKREVEVNLDHVAAVPGEDPHPASTMRVGPDPGRPGGDLPYGSIPPIPFSQREIGIVGGRSVSASGSSVHFPPGAVAGAEGSPANGGRAMPRTMGGGFGGPHGSTSGPAVGRRLAMEPGGVVGGRQGAAVSQPFTQGGSGLLRNGPVVGAAGVPTSNRWRGDQGAERPDYLLEDEETWQSHRRVVPPVID